MGEARDLVDRCWDAIVSGDVERLRVFAAECIAEDVEFRDPSAGTYHGRDATVAGIGRYMTSFSGFRREVVDAVEGGDAVVMELRISADHTSPLPRPDGGELPATGRTVVWESVDVIHAAGGRLVSWHTYYDNLAVMAQLGLAPAPADA